MRNNIMALIIINKRWGGLKRSFYYFKANNNIINVIFIIKPVIYNKNITRKI